MTMNSTLSSSSSSMTSLRAMPFAKAFPVALVLSSIVVLCICGNILVILSVFTFRPLRTVQNFFIVSLAFSDMLVAILVMPFHIVTHILDRWIFGKIFCQIFVTSDVLLCTSSILNLCAIALDRYWAISDPIQYARQRTIRRVLLMIMLVWILSATISVPPIIAQMLGSSELETYNFQQCELSRNKAYVIYSACGSFYIPALIMTIVYAHVFIETRKRFRERAKAAAKLANATQRSNGPCSPDTTKMNNTKHKHHRRHHRKHLILHPVGSSSFKSLASNGSVGENFSTDEKDDELMTSLDPSVNNHNQLMINNNQNSSSVTPEHSDSMSNQNGSGIIQQQHASVQTSEALIKSSTRSSKDGGRRSLFKGKSLATLMNERQKISLTRERRLSRTLGIIISVFLLCWLPFFVVYILSAFIDISNYVIEPFPTLFLWLGYINSACNPLIYTVFNVEFRMAFKRLLCPSSMNNSNNNTIHRYTTNRFSRN